MIRADGADVLRDPEVLGAAAALPVPTTLLWAARGMLDEPQGLYDEERIAPAGLPAHVDVHRVDDTNHYTVVLLPQGAGPVAAAVRQAVERG